MIVDLTDNCGPIAYCSCDPFRGPTPYVANCKNPGEISFVPMGSIDQATRRDETLVIQYDSTLRKPCRGRICSDEKKEMTRLNLLFLIAMPFANGHCGQTCLIALQCLQLASVAQFDIRERGNPVDEIA